MLVFTAIHAWRYIINSNIFREQKYTTIYYGLKGRNMFLMEYIYIYIAIVCYSAYISIFHMVL